MTNHVAQLLPDLPTAVLRPKITNQRQYILSLFAEKLCVPSIGYKTLTPKTIAVLLSHLSVDRLYALYGNCEKASCGFAPAWWHSLKTEYKAVDKRFDYKKKWSKIKGSDIKN